VLLRNEGAAAQVTPGGAGQKRGKVLFSTPGAQGQHRAGGAAAHTGIVTQEEGEKTVDKKTQFHHYSIDHVEHTVYMAYFAAPVQEKGGKKRKKT
jgi:hypothetical protein